MRSAKLFNLLIVFVMLAGMLAACAAPTAAPAPAQEAAPVEEAAPAQEAAPTEAAAEPAAAAPAADTGARRIRTLYLVTQDQGSDPKEYEIARFTAESLKALGLDVELNAMPWEQVSDLVWYQRDKWDFTVWQIPGRPGCRSDPDELVYNLYHSSTAETGYNFVGYLNPEYDKLVTEAQRMERLGQARRAGQAGAADAGNGTALRFLCPPVHGLRIQQRGLGSGHDRGTGRHRRGELLDHDRRDARRGACWCW